MLSIVFGACIITHASSLRRSRGLSQCPQNLPSHDALRIALRRRHHLLMLCLPRIHDPRHQLRHRLHLALQLLRHLGSHQLVRHLADLPQVLQGHESTAFRQKHAPVHVSPTALPRMVRRLWLRVCALRASSPSSPPLSLCCLMST